MLTVFGLIILFIVIFTIVSLMTDSIPGGSIVAAVITGGIAVVVYGPEEETVEAVAEETVASTPPLIESFQTMLEFLATDLVLGLAALVVFGFIIFSVESERFITGIISFLAFVLAFNWLRDGVVWSWVLENAILFGAYFVLYLAIGVGAGVYWKWRKYATINADPERRKEWQSRNAGETLDKYYKDRRAFAMHPLNHKMRITNWVLLWPSWLFWTLLHDPITWLWDTVYKALAGILLSIAVTADRQAAQKQDDE